MREGEKGGEKSRVERRVGYREGEWGGEESRVEKKSRVERRVGLMCIQETRWTGNKTRNIAAGWQGKNSVGTILDNAWK